MAIQPVRPIGSTLTLEFAGVITVGAVAQANFPKNNAELPSDVTTASEWNVRFLLADATDPSDQTTRLAPTVYDDSQPAGASPHPTTLAGATNQVKIATDQIINATWAKNAEIEIVKTVPGGTATAISFDRSAAFFVLDTADSGLGRNTGLPVLVLPTTITFAPGVPNALVIIRITIRHSTIR